MDPPIVYIEKEPFLNMVIASIETFKRECLGLIFGTIPSRNRNYFVITNVVAIQLAKKRKNSEVDQSNGSKKRMQGIFDKYPHIYRPIGDFHSHPEWGDIKRLPSLSDADVDDMAKQNLQICIVVKISTINKERIVWEQAQDGGIRGSLGKYKFHINVIRLIKGNKQQCLLTQAPAAVKALNRALGYK